MADGKKTACERGSYNGRPTLSIWEIDPAGNKLGKAPIVSFGVTKAKEIVEHKDEIVKFLIDNGYNPPSKA
jgi:hypothetical protein